jgi:hypothetical protein
MKTLQDGGGKTKINRNQDGGGRHLENNYTL